MEEERYKMIYISSIVKESRDKANDLINKKNFKEIKNDNIRIFGHDFVKNNKNKVKLIINNKKHNLKEFINNKEFIDNKIKIIIILDKRLSNREAMFENCRKLKEFVIYDNILNIDDEEEYEFKEYSYNYFNYNEDNNHINLYKNLRSEYIFVLQ